MPTSRPVYVALGSNLGDREAHLAAAVDALRASPELQDIQVSRWWATEPVSDVPQGEFLNGALRATSTADPHTLLERLMAVEASLGRVRTVRNGPRTIDLDLLLVGDLVVSSPTLTLPHPEMANRRFVLDPLLEVGADAIHPIHGCSIAELAAALAAEQANTIEDAA